MVDGGQLGGRACASCRANNREPIGGLDEITQVIAMSDTTIKKVEAASSPRGEMGQRYLVAGKRVSMRFWELEPGKRGQTLDQPGIRDGRLCHLRERQARTGGANIASQERRLLAGARQGDASIHKHRTLQGH